MISNHVVHILNGMGHFKIVVVIVSGIQRFMKHIVRNGMQCSVIGPSCVISMNHLAHQPKILLHLIRHISQGFHIFEIHHISGIQADSVNIKLSHPESHHITNIVLHRRISLIQLCQKVISAPVCIGKSIIIRIITPEIHIAIPIFVL